MEEEYEEFDGLTAKQRAFCHEYLVDLNGKESAIRAGYSKDTAKSIASENLSKPYLAEKIQHLMDLRAKRTEITADKVLVELAKLAFADIRKTFNGDALTMPSALDDDTAASIQSIKVITKLGEKDENGNASIDCVHEIKLVDKKGALEALGKNLKLFSDVKDINIGVQDSLTELLEQINGTAGVIDE